MPETTTIVNTAPTASPLATEIGTPPPVKPGWQTTEFWERFGAVGLTILFASGVMTGHDTALAIAGMAATILGSLGYTVSRTLVKTAASKGAVVTSAVRPTTTT